MAEEPIPSSFQPSETPPESSPVEKAAPSKPKTEPEAKPTESKTEPKAEPTESKAGKPSVVSNAMGNLVLLLILLCLVAIPFLVYFTDVPSRLKRNLNAALSGRAAPAAGETIEDAELREALGRVQKLESEIAQIRIAALEAAGLPTETQNPTPRPEAPINAILPRTEYDVAKLFNGINVRTELDLQEGSTASKERGVDAAYEFEVKLKIKVPKANQSLTELATLNGKLPEMLPGLATMLQTAQVSPYYDKLYAEKHKRIKSTVTRLHSVETRHNYFDCETILNLTHPDTGQKVLLMQGEMDVVADGSDGDRMPEVDDYISLSAHYQATTSLGWPKKTQTPNPLLERFEKELEEILKEYAIPGLSADRNRYLLSRRDKLKLIIPDLKGRSFLIAEADPFIVLPLSLLGGSGSHAPAIGDYAVVIHGDKAYPAICGDAGPSWKMGEASLFVATTINEGSTPYQRPVSDLKVTYLVFPKSRDAEKGPPDLAAWNAKCQQLLNGAGGLGEGFELYDWRDIVAERGAVRESKKMIGASNRHLADADGFARTAKDAVTASKAAAATAAKALADAKAATEPPANLADLETAAMSATAAVEKTQAAATEATTAAADAKAAIKEIEAAAVKAVAASKKSPQTPRAESTDLAVSALEAAKAAFKRAEAGAATAKQAAAKAKAAAGTS
ncbi:MAG: hypothetical protein ACI8UO_001980 [Verrucomicrobiales bacterium]|jgi:hypothetical protein